LTAAKSEVLKLCAQLLRTQEVNFRSESVPVAEGSRISLELLDHSIERFGSGVGRSGHHGGDDDIEVLFDHPGHFFDRL